MIDFMMCKLNTYIIYYFPYGLIYQINNNQLNFP